jgi:hypothetical protein
MTSTLVTPGAIPALVAAQGDIPEPILAAGELRQGVKPSRLALLSGAALVELWRPRRSKTLPRRFALVVTEQRVLVYKSWGGGEGDDYTLHLRGGIVAAFPRAAVSVAGGDTLVIDDERIPVFCPDLTDGGDSDTKATLALLEG